ncbi:hypothetical protein C440_01435 [Haloferax mucosum ATCC BAA-1512]|uniref:Uncharacterized protein n=1 Tax=Haloferax mucosum ATCC BAA-1512 TaxID=662479 RepID=M0ISI3_9EURY|nr:hypothetical protein [Haloferax mucosum]ELZ98977.1 hypothetical protein C440_01435 [Haloferax mucosum ATCC BAA-1512]
MSFLSRSRRRALQTLGGVATMALCGCTGAPNPFQAPSARIAEVQLLNTDAAVHRFGLRIETDETVTYERTHVVAPARKVGTDETVTSGDSSTNDSVTAEPVPVVSDGLPAERGRQTVSVEVVGEGEHESVTYEDEACYSVVVEYQSGTLNFFSSRGDDKCPDSQS